MVLCSIQFLFPNISQNYQFSVSIFKGWVATASVIARFMDIVGAWTSFHELNYALGLTHLRPMSHLCTKHAIALQCKVRSIFPPVGLPQ